MIVSYAGAGGLLTVAILMASDGRVTGRGKPAPPEIRLMTLDPGHFHAALVQKTMYPGVSPQVHVFAPLGADLTAHLNRISAYNARQENPTAWQLEVHASPDYFERMLESRPGNVVVISGRNRGKVERIRRRLRRARQGRLARRLLGGGRKQAGRRRRRRAAA